jgi:hypothetical protein
LSCFALPASFPAVPSALGSVFMFCAPGLVFDDTEGVGSCFHVLRPRTHFRQYRGRRVPFSCFAPPYSFSTVLRASGLIFMFCVSELVFGGTEPVGSLCDPFSRAPHRRWAMGCGRRTRRSLPSVHLFNAGLFYRLDQFGCTFRGVFSDCEFL